MADKSGGGTRRVLQIESQQLGRGEWHRLRLWPIAFYHQDVWRLECDCMTSCQFALPPVHRCCNSWWPDWQCASRADLSSHLLHGDILTQTYLRRCSRCAFGCMDHRTRAVISACSSGRYEWGRFPTSWNGRSWQYCSPFPLSIVISLCWISVPSWRW